MRLAALASAPCAVAEPSGPYSFDLASIQTADGCIRITSSVVRSLCVGARAWPFVLLLPLDCPLLLLLLLTRPLDAEELRVFDKCAYVSGCTRTPPAFAAVAKGFCFAASAEGSCIARGLLSCCANRKPPSLATSGSSSASSWINRGMVLELGGSSKFDVHAFAAVLGVMEDGKATQVASKRSRRSQSA